MSSATPGPGNRPGAGNPHQGDAHQQPVGGASSEAQLDAADLSLARMRDMARSRGLRPGAPDGMPFIGAVPGIDGLFVNAGHYRNGLVLAPATTRLLVDQLLDRVPILDPEPFHLSASTIEARHSSLAG